MRLTLLHRYTGLLAGYAIGLVTWSWYSDCPDCPKVTLLNTTNTPLVTLVL